MNEFSDFVSFNILGQSVNLLSLDDEYDYPEYLVAEIEDKYYYLGKQDADINSAIIAWQYHYDMILTDQEISSLTSE